MSSRWSLALLLTSGCARLSTTPESTETGVATETGVDATDAFLTDSGDASPDVVETGDDGSVDADAAVTWPEVGPPPCPLPTGPASFRSLGAPMPLAQGVVTTSGEAILFSNELVTVAWNGKGWDEAWVRPDKGGRWEWDRWRNRYRPGRMPGGFLVLDPVSIRSRAASGEWTTSVTCPAGSSSAPIRTKSGATLVWGPSTTGLLRAPTTSDAASPLTPPILSVGSQRLDAEGDRVLAWDRLSLDGGATFGTLPTPPFAPAGYVLTSGAVCAFGASGGIARRADGGAFASVASDFTLIVPPAPPVADLTSHGHPWDASGDRVFAIGSTTKGLALARSIDGCRTWTFLALPSSTVWDVGITTSGVVLADGQRLWSSSDDGASFVALPLPRSTLVEWVDGWLDASCKPEWTVAGWLQRSAAFSQKGTAEWTRIEAPVFDPPCFGDCDGTMPEQWVDPKRGTLFRWNHSKYAALFEGKWESVLDGSYAHGLWFDGDRVFAGTHGSLDGGKTWTKTTPLAFGLGFDGAHTAWRLGPGSTDGFERSLDLVTWTAVGKRYPKDSSWITKYFVTRKGRLYAMDRTPDEVTAGASYGPPEPSSGGEVWFSDDGGTTWSVLATKWSSFLPVGDGVLFNTLADGLELSWDGGVTSEQVHGLARTPYLVRGVADHIVVAVGAPWGKSGGGLFVLERGGK